jgi:hypothetical protein
MPPNDLFSVGPGAAFGSMSQFQMAIVASVSNTTKNIILSGIYRY